MEFISCHSSLYHQVALVLLTVYKKHRWISIGVVYQAVQLHRKRANDVITITGSVGSDISGKSYFDKQNNLQYATTIKPLLIGKLGTLAMRVKGEGLGVTATSVQFMVVQQCIEVWHVKGLFTQPYLKRYVFPFECQYKDFKCICTNQKYFFPESLNAHSNYILKTSHSGIILHYDFLSWKLKLDHYPIFSILACCGIHYIVFKVMSAIFKMVSLSSYGLSATIGLQLTP